MELTPRVRRWREAGETVRFRDRDIHMLRREGEGPLLLLLHGFPSSSYDWRLVLEAKGDGQALLACDFLGFGLSEKPRDHDYSLFWQADLVEELVRRHGGGRPVFVVAHDMGTSVATELIARSQVASSGVTRLACTSQRSRAATSFSLVSAWSCRTRPIDSLER
jgi:pimeloyl-ACP methyl ester carboxylesterase